MTCPTCGEALVPIAYGYPSQELFEAAERKAVVLGGCIVEPGQPDLACPWQGDGHL
jgi:hypothetical protein